MPAQRTLEHQAAYPSQAEGGFAGDLHNSLHRALVAWEKRRNPNGDPFKFGRAKGMFTREKVATATRAEISWNAAPEAKREPSKEKQQAREEARREEARRWMRQSRAKETPEQRAERLAKRRADRLALNPPKPKMSPEERARKRAETKKRYMARKTAGLIVKREPKRKMSVEQLAKKAERQRGYEAANKVIRTA
jgi:hypothetical protein